MTALLHEWADAILSEQRMMEKAVELILLLLWEKQMVTYYFYLKMAPLYTLIYYNIVKSLKAHFLVQFSASIFI